MELTLVRTASSTYLPGEMEDGSFHVDRVHVLSCPGSRRRTSQQGQASSVLGTTSRYGTLPFRIQQRLTTAAHNTATWFNTARTCVLVHARQCC